MNNIVLVQPGLYLGNVTHIITLSKEFIDCKINVSINCCNEITYESTNLYTAYQFPIDDDAMDDSFVKYMDEIVDLIHEKLLNNLNVYVHCVHGVSRSAAVIIYYLMKYNKLSFDKAYNTLLFIKPSISPHINFVKELKKKDTHAQSNTGGFSNRFSNIQK